MSAFISINALDAKLNYVVTNAANHRLTTGDPANGAAAAAASVSTYVTTVTSPVSDGGQGRQITVQQGNIPSVTGGGGTVDTVCITNAGDAELLTKTDVVTPVVLADNDNVTITAYNVVAPGAELI